MERLRVLFEGREAIYVEKGALRVKVTDIRADVAQQYVSAEVEEIPTTGLPVGALYESKQLWVGPFCWSIGGGYLLTTPAMRVTAAGHCSSLRGIVQGIQSLALRFPDSLDPFQRYNGVLDYL